MRWTASAPVTWPSDERLAELWTNVGRQIAEQDDLLTESPDGDRWELVSGEQARPGSYYRFTSPTLTRARLAGRIDDAGVVHFELAGLPLKHGPVAGALLADGLNHPNHATASGQIGPLKAEFAANMNTRRAEFAVKLPWIRVNGETSEAEGTLSTTLTARVTSLAAPLLHKLLKELGGEDIQESIDAFTTGLAKGLTDWSTGELNRLALEEGIAPAADLARRGPSGGEQVEEYGRRLLQSARRLQSQMDQRGWWGRRSAAWRREAEATLPTMGGHSLAASTARDVRSLVISDLGRRGHRDRGASMESVISSSARSMARAIDQSSFQFAESEPTNWDEALDLDWLANLRSILRKGRSAR